MNLKQTFVALVLLFKLSEASPRNKRSTQHIQTDSLSSWTDVESYVIMSAPKSFTKFKEVQELNELLSAMRVLNRGDFPGKKSTQPDYWKLMKSDLRKKSSKKMRNKKLADTHFGLKGVLNHFPFTILF